MKVYLAARYPRIYELNGYADELRGAGHEVTSRWLLGNHQIHRAIDLVEAATVSIPIEGQPFALDDYDDVARADVVVSFTEPPRTYGASRGGRHVEFGLALAWNKRVLVVGPRENVFHTLPQVEHFWEWGPEVIQRLTDPFAHPVFEGSRFDYRNQAWLVNGTYQDCGHPEAVDCECFGRIHEGEMCDPANYDIH